MNRAQFLKLLAGSTASLALGLPFTSAAKAQETPEIAEMSLGDPDAPIKIVEYASFTCGHCANFHATVFQELKKNYIDTGKVYFTHREVYFDRFGLWAGMVARCGGEMRYFGISEMLYAGMKDWLGKGDPAEVADNLRRIGKTAGLPEDQLEACLADNDNAQALVAWYQENAQADGIDSTPTF
ncbi:MAG: DsbA family protein, partial [Mangrovicoccus sp.]|nr:DsbA family protein [Mangrovicoccus sp.]